jgi:hypothetical protein
MEFQNQNRTATVYELVEDEDICGGHPQILEEPLQLMDQRPPQTKLSNSLHARPYCY